MIRCRTLRPSSAYLNSSLWFNGVRSPSAHAPVAFPACRAGRCGVTGAADTRQVSSRAGHPGITVHYVNPVVALWGEPCVRDGEPGCRGMRLP